MKQFIMMVATAICFTACTNEKKEKTESEKTDSQMTSSPAVTLPYTATFSSQFNDKVSDQDLLNVLNSYKHWESGDMAALSGVLADSITYLGWDGTKYSGPKAALLEIWTKYRDSLSAVKIEIAAWTKSHSIDKQNDFIDVWYKETDTYKTGKIDSFNLMDANGVTNGKISWYSQYRQALKK